MLAFINEEVHKQKLLHLSNMLLDISLPVQRALYAQAGRTLELLTVQIPTGLQKSSIPGFYGSSSSKARKVSHVSCKFAI